MKTRMFKGHEVVDLREGDPGVAMCNVVGPSRRGCNRPIGHAGRHVACSIDLGGEPIEVEDVWGPSDLVLDPKKPHGSSVPLGYGSARNVWVDLEMHRAAFEMSPGEYTLTTVFSASRGDVTLRFDPDAKPVSWQKVIEHLGVDRRAFLKYLREQAAEAMGVLAAEQLRLVNEFPPSDLEDLKEQGAVYPFTREDLVWSVEWDCEASPTGQCVYDLNSDPGDCDECIYCKEPLERK